MDKNNLLKNDLFTFFYVAQKNFYYSGDSRANCDEKNINLILEGKGDQYLEKIYSDPIRNHLNKNAPKRAKKLAKIVSVNEKFEEIKEVVSENYWINEVSAISEYIYYICEGVAAIAFSMTDNGFTIIYGVSHKGNFVEPAIYFISTLDENASKNLDYLLDNLLPEEINDEENSVKITYCDLLFWFSERSPTYSELLVKGSNSNLILTEDNKRFIKEKLLNLEQDFPGLCSNLSNKFLVEFQIDQDANTSIFKSNKITI